MALTLGAGAFLLTPQGFFEVQGSDDMRVSAQEGPYQIERRESVEYFSSAKGYLARPDSRDSRPGVVMIHEWWGLNDNIQEAADRLAAQGYQVLAVDLYHGEVVTTPERARELSGSIDQSAASENLAAAVQFLLDMDAPTIGSLGWCFGGGQSLQLALSGVPLDATVIYYGELVTDPAELESISWPVLGIFGDQDTSIPVEEVEKFRIGLDQAGVQSEIHIYQGVGHAFANPSGDNYAPEETADAWEKTLGFLKETLSP